MMKPIQVCMLGEFTLQAGDVLLRESGSRSRRLFSLLSFLICHRAHPVSQYKLIAALWGDHTEFANPENTLRLLVHRARAQLDQLYEGAGQACILRKDGTYCWNPHIPLVIDYERFEQLYQNNAGDPKARLSDLQEALSLYQGEFLARQSSDSWVIPIGTHFQNVFLQASKEAVQLLYQSQRYEEAEKICRRWLATEPYSESAARMLMQILVAVRNPREAEEVYETLRRRLFSDFGIHPSQETRALYRTVMHAPGNQTIAMEEILQQVQEPECMSGALQCDYDYFKMLCYAQRRSQERSGVVTHLALLSVTGSTEVPLRQRSLSRIMGQLGQSLVGNLRRGDVICQCSPSQYILMLPNASYENSCMVCRRLMAVFRRNHPRVTARIHYLVQPLTADSSMPV